ncbi:MAG TPA: hypothetical protein VLZ83_09595 [Edaphocola sp.]|nr:hypothetical protein [Edaphocola sp.]
MKILLNGIKQGFFLITILFFSCNNLPKTEIKNDNFILKYPLGWNITTVSTTGSINFQLFNITNGSSKNPISLNIIVFDNNDIIQIDSLESKTKHFIFEYRKVADPSTLKYLNLSDTDIVFNPIKFKEIDAIKWSKRETTISSTNGRKPVKSDLIQNAIAYPCNDNLIIVQYQFDNDQSKDSKDTIQKILDNFSPSCK